MGKCLALAVAALALALTGCTSGPDPEVHSKLAERACERAIESKLKSPSSASYVDVVTELEPNGQYTVLGEVDADNSFGASLRSRFGCVVTVTDNEATVTDSMIE